MYNTTAKRHFLAGLFLICMCGLMLQIIETRILSVIAYYHLAFFAISMAMFGMTGGSLFVHFRKSWFPGERLLENMVWISAAFGLAVVISTLMLISTVVLNIADEFFLAALPMALLLWLKLILILLIPYFFAGMAISLALTRSPWPVPLVYGVDLIGAATGCLAVLVVLTLMDAVSALFLVGAFGAFAAVFFSAALRATGHPVPALLPVARMRIFAQPGALAVVLTALALANAMSQPNGLKLSVVKNQVETPTGDSFVRWNSFSRINVNRSANGRPQMWGPSAATPEFAIDARSMAIDGSAGTQMYRFDGDLSKMGFLKYDITNLAYSIRNSGRAAIIGVGGGRDVLSAKLFGFDDVTGVELNPIFIDLLTGVLADYNRLSSTPGVRLVVDEARSWFARSNDRFDLMQMSMIDTWAATGAGAFSLSENGLYTVEGWRTFLDHLAPTGVFTVSRWYAPSNIREIGRLMSLAVATLFDEGVANPREHVFLATTTNLATLIVSRAPFSADELATLAATADRLGFSVAEGPQSPIASPLLSEILAARTPEEATSTARRLSASQHIDMTAPTDDRPFFFNMLRFDDLGSLELALGSARGVARGNLLATATLTIIVALSAILVTLTIVVPSLPSLRQVSPSLAELGTAYFLLIGLAFMFVEIGIIQRISVFLGHPIYGLAIGLFGIILSTGVGSLLVSSFRAPSSARLLLWVATFGLYLILLPLWFPEFSAKFASADLFMRAMVSLAAIIPSGVLMGFGFPAGMEIVKSIDSSPAPWFWAVNGAAGVLAAGLAVALSIACSITVTLWVGAACYLALGPVVVLLARLRRAERAQRTFALAASATSP